MTLDTAPPDRLPAVAARPRHSFRRRLVRRSVPLAAAGMIGVAGTVVVMPPPMYADSQYVWQAARVWPEIPADFPVLHHAMRLGTVLPTRVMQELLGSGQVAWVAAAALFAALFTAGVYALGRALFGNFVGLSSAALVMIHPFFTLVDPYTRAVANSTGGLLPDMPSAGLFSFGVAALVVAARRQDRRQVAWLAAAGGFFGLAYLTREFAAFLFLAVPVFFWLLGLPRRRLLATAAPMSAVMIIELIHNAVVYGDPVARLTVAGEHEAALSEPLSIRGVLLRFAEAMNWHPLGWLFVLALAITICSAIATRDPRLRLLAVWFVALWLPFTVLGGLLDSADPSLRTHLVRYWFLVLPPIVTGAVASVQLLVGRLNAIRPQGATVAATMAAVAVTAYAVSALAEARGISRDSDWRELRSWLGEHPGIAVVRTDSRTAQTAAFYARSPMGDLVWGGQFEVFSPQTEEPLADVVTRGPYLRSTFGAGDAPDPRVGWQVVWRSSNGVLEIWDRDLG